MHQVLANANKNQKLLLKIFNKLKLSIFKIIVLYISLTTEKVVFFNSQIDMCKKHTHVRKGKALIPSNVFTVPIFPITYRKHPVNRKQATRHCLSQTPHRCRPSELQLLLLLKLRLQLCWWPQPQMAADGGGLGTYSPGTSHIQHSIRILSRPFTWPKALQGISA